MAGQVCCPTVSSSNEYRGETATDGNATSPPVCEKLPGLAKAKTDAESAMNMGTDMGTAMNNSRKARNVKMLTTQGFSPIGGRYEVLRCLARENDVIPD